MANYSTSEFRSGLKVMLDGDPCSITENELVKPGKGQAFSRVRLRNLATEFWHFMMVDGSFEQFAADEKAVGDCIKWLKEQDKYVVTLYNGAPLTITPPNFVELEVVETDPGLKGDTAQGGTKPAKFASGASVNVPLFINIGEVLKIDTRSGEYVSRAKS